MRRRQALFDIHSERIDGIPVFWADSPLGFAAGLVFRVGRVDEQLANSGVTHLVEHLALPSHATETPFNGTVGAAATSFWAEGERAEVLELLAGVARCLSEPPLDRLEHERRILLTEAASSGGGVVRHVASLRLGPVGFGLIG
jgi:zinc protease